MRLYIGKISAEQLLSTLYCDSLNNINIFAAAVITLSGISLSIFVCKNASHCCHNSRRNDILTCDKLKIALLAFELVRHSIG